MYTIMGYPMCTCTYMCAIYHNIMTWYGAGRMQHCKCSMPACATKPTCE